VTYDELPPQLAGALRKVNDAQAKHDAICTQMQKLGDELRAAAADLIPARRDLNAILSRIST